VSVRVIVNLEFEIGAISNGPINSFLLYLKFTVKTKGHSIA
jgi:hypothetical protein